MIDKIIERFGEKVKYANIKEGVGNHFSIHADMSKEKLLELLKTDTFAKALEEYPERVWLVPVIQEDGAKTYHCPECEHQLGGLFGSFQWGIAHGYGYCNNCNKVGFTYYHYIGGLQFCHYAVTNLML